MKLSKNILKLIQERAAKRNYETRVPSISTISKIIKAGVWGPSIHHFQPWKFVVVLNRVKTKRIAELLLNRSKINIPNFMFFPTIRALKTCPVLVAIYCDSEFSNYARRIIRTKIRVAQLTEVSAIAAAVQNMILVAESVGVSTCWLDLPILYEKGVNKILGENNKLVALLAVGYSKETGLRASRKSFKDTIRYIW